MFLTVLVDKGNIDPNNQSERLHFIFVVSVYLLLSRLGWCNMAMSLPCSGGEMSSRQGSVVCLTVIPQTVPNVNGSPAADISVCILQTSSSDRVGEESLRLGKAYPISSGGLGRCVAQLQRRLFPQRHCCFFFLKRKTQLEATSWRTGQEQRRSRLWGRGEIEAREMREQRLVDSTFCSWQKSAGRILFC